LILKTEHPDWRVRFYPSLYQLRLRKGDKEEKLDLGFAGSRLLERLLAQPGELVSREELLAYAWPERVVSQGSLNQQIYNLRQILGDEREHRIIQTVPRRGYMFNPAFLVERTRECSVQEERPQDTVQPLPPPQPRRSGWLVPALAFLGGVTLALGSSGLVYLSLADARLVKADVDGANMYILYVNKTLKPAWELAKRPERRDIALD